MLLDNQNKELDLVKNIINTMFLLTKHLRIYDRENKLVETTTSRLLLLIESYLAYHKSLDLTVARHGFLYGEDFVERKNKTFEAFAYLLFQHGVCAVTIDESISAHDIQGFLSLAARPPAESWEEGGLARSLQQRKISSISVQEMSESDLAYLDEIKPIDRQELLREKSPVWDRFAFAVFRGLTAKAKAGSTDDLEPGQLAGMTNKILAKMSRASQQKFGKALGDFLVTLQNEKIRPYRIKALTKLSEFINRISPEIRERLFRNIFNLNMRADFAEEFYTGFSDEIIINILEKSTQQDGYVPPVILKVLGKIARDKNLQVGDVKALDQKLVEKRVDISKLFQKDDFEKYVPESYRNALLNIIQNDTLPKKINAELVHLKQGLEESVQGKHTADIILNILNGSPDPELLEGLQDNLPEMIMLYLDEGDYKGLNALYRVCSAQEQGEVLCRCFAEEGVVRETISGIGRYGKPTLSEIETLVLEVGRPFAGPLLTALGEETNRTHRMHYLQILQKLDPKDVISEAVKHLDDRRWYFVRNIVYILRNLKDKAVLPYLKPLRQHPHHKVRMEVLRACLQNDCEDATGELLRMLDSDDSETVDAAVSLALMTRDPAIVNRLLEMLSENAVFDYRFEQKKAILQTLSEMAPKEVLPTLGKILSSVNLVHPKQQEKLRQEIIKVLPRFDKELLRPGLTQLLTRTSGDTRERLQNFIDKELGTR